ncbi:MAG: hypothetical protein H6843_01255 [Rhodospirillaceae bacterium]|nr:hypothetical protein [Rhodospirillaceae bacterium]
MKTPDQHPLPWPKHLPELLPGNALTPLLDAAETYAALADAVRSAQRTIHMAYWTLNPEMPAGAPPEATDQPGWNDLLCDAAARGVSVRLILSDFDPVAAAELHRDTWASYRRLMAARARLPEDARDRLTVQCAYHEASTGAVTNLAAQALSRKLARATVGGIAETYRSGDREAACLLLGEMPGLWPLVAVRDGDVRLKPRLIPAIHPGSHHEKLCVIDSRIVFAGGLDIEPKRYDTPDHRARDAWHDLACRVEGPVVGRVEQHFAQRWNRRAAEFLKRLERLVPPEGVEPLPIGRVDLLDETLPADGPSGSRQPHAGEVEAALACTLSGRRRSPFAVGPKAELRQVAEVYRHLVSQAQRFIYIETQFFRSLDVAEWLAQRGEANRALQVILLLPLAPERISLSPNPNPATRHGQYLQGRALDRVRAALGDRLGVFTLLRNGPAPARVHAEAKAYGSDEIYVHSKAMVVDDAVAVIGSANLNGRSLYTDTESVIAWRHPAQVRAFREQLWSALFSRDAKGWTDDPLAHWRAIAEANRRAAPGHRQGFVVPMPDSHAAILAKRNLLVPDRLV